METIPKSYITAKSATIPIPGIPNVPAVRTVMALTGRTIPVKGERVLSIQRHRNPQRECRATLHTVRTGRKSHRISSRVIRAGIRRTTIFSKGHLPENKTSGSEKIRKNRNRQLSIFCHRPEQKKRKTGRRKISRYFGTLRAQYPVVLQKGGLFFCKILPQAAVVPERNLCYNEDNQRNL